MSRQAPLHGRADPVSPIFQSSIPRDREAGARGGDGAAYFDNNRQIPQHRHHRRPDNRDRADGTRRLGDGVENVRLGGTVGAERVGDGRSVALAEPAGGSGEGRGGRADGDGDVAEAPDDDLRLSVSWLAPGGFMSGEVCRGGGEGVPATGRRQQR